MKRDRLAAWMCVGAACGALALPAIARAYDPFLETPDAATVEQSAAYRHANMGGQAALDELRARGVLFQQQGPARGVETPIRLTGRLHGVHIHSALPEAQRITTPFEICDARLALALDDFAAILERHGIDEVVHYSMYRPAPPPQPARRGGPPGVVPSSSAPLPPLPQPDQDGLAPISMPQPGRNTTARASGSGGRATTMRLRSGPSAAPRVPMAGAQALVTREAKATRHPAGLAIDVATLRKKSGEWLSVAGHFAGRIGAQTCGAGVTEPTDAKAKELRAIVCEASAARVFTYVLTPNYNAPHRDHFHMEIKPGVRWFLVH